MGTRLARYRSFLQNRRVETAVFCVCVFGFGVTLSLLPAAVANVCILIGAVGLAHQVFTTYRGRIRLEAPWPLSRIPSWSVLALPVGLLLGYYTVSAGATLTQVVVLVALLFVCFYFWYILPVAWFQLHQQSVPEAEQESPTASLSILVPAYNEGGYIGRCIDALAAAKYSGPKEIIVVDDGSTDTTYREARAHATDETYVLRRENGGKHAALNTGLERASGDVVVTVDADSRIDESALVEIVTDLQADPSVGAVAGTVRLDRLDTLVEKLQALEYAVGINTFRRAFAVTEAVNVVPGCLGCFRRTAMEEVGGYDGDTMTEDYDITLQLLKAGWTVRASEALVYTEAPRTWRGLFDQRLRWKHGNIETLIKHRDLLGQTRFSNFSSLVYPYQLVSLFAMPIATVVILWTVLLGLASGEWQYITTIVVLFAALEFLGTSFALSIDSNSLWLGVYSPLVLVVYRHFIVVVTLKAMLDVLRQVEQTWVSPRADPSAGQAGGEPTAPTRAHTEEFDG